MVDRQSREGVLLIALTVLAVCAAFVPLPAGLRALLVAPLVLWLPGYGIVRAAFANRWSPLETCVLASGLSLAICVLCGVLLHVVGWLTPTGWALLLGAISIASITAAMASGQPMHWTWSAPSLKPADWVCLILAVVLAAAAIQVSRMNAFAHREFAFTDLWLVPSHGAPNGLTVGIANHEGRPATFDLQVRTDGRLTGQWGGISLEAGESWTGDIPTPGHEQTMKRWRVEVVLFKDGDDERAYRKVWASSSLRPTRGRDPTTTSEASDATLAAADGEE